MIRTSNEKRSTPQRGSNMSALRHEGVGKEEEKSDEFLKPFVGTLRVRFPSGRAGRQPEASLACRSSDWRCEA